MKTLKVLIIALGTILFVVNASAAGSCDGDKEKTKLKCNGEQLAAASATLAAGGEIIDAKDIGVGKLAKDSKDRAAAIKTPLDKNTQECLEAIKACTNSCAAEQTAKQPTDPAGAQKAATNKNYCMTDAQKVADAQQKASGDLGQMMQALGALLSALGAGGDTPTAETPLCTQNPNDPQCKTDTATTDGGSTLATGEFRRDDGPSTVEGDLGLQADPTSGPAAQATQAAGIAGAGSAGLGGGGGGGNSSPRGRDSGDKKSDFDGSPKINLAGGAMGGGAGGGGSARGAGTIGKGGGNPTASRTAIDGESQAGKIAAAADERLRGPASNEPLGGISSVYYLDNFSKVEKRMTTERNTLQEH